MSDEMDPIAELGKLLQESGAYVYMHLPGCTMKGCACRKLSLRMDAITKLLRQALDALKGVGEVEVPERGHTGSCGPEAGCDGLCMAASYVSERNYKVRQALTALKKHFGES